MSWLDVLSHFGAFLVGVLLAAWHYRRLIAAAIEWGQKALADGKITKEELADLLETLGRKLREEQ
jgi:Kef-type K+ transport system membrane component KefB